MAEYDNDSSLQNPNLRKRFAVPVNLGEDLDEGQSVFSTTVNTGNFYTNFTAFFRQSYDFGIKDSVIINDSTTEYLFYPKFRFQHTLNYSTAYTYKFRDTIEALGIMQHQMKLYLNDGIIYRLTRIH